MAVVRGRRLAVDRERCECDWRWVAVIRGRRVAMGTGGGIWTSLLSLREAALRELFTGVGLLDGEGAQTVCHLFVKR